MSKVFCLRFVCDLTKGDCQPSEPVSTRSTTCLHGARHVYISTRLSTWRPARLHGAQHVYMAPNMSRSVQERPGSVQERPRGVQEWPGHPGASRSGPGASRSAQDVPQERPGTSRSVAGTSMSVAKVGHMRKMTVSVGGPGPYVDQNGRFACPVEQIRRSCQWQGSWCSVLCGPEWPFCAPCHENAVFSRRQMGQNGRFVCPVQRTWRSCQWQGSWAWALGGP